MPDTKSWCKQSMLGQCINIEALNNCLNENIFLDKFTYCICVDFFLFGIESFFSSFKKFLQKLKEDSLYIGIVSKGELLYCFEYDLNSKDESFFQRVIDESFHNATDKDEAFKIVLYTKNCNWVALFDLNYELGIFTFEDMDIATQFVEEMERRDLYTPKEVVESIWHNPKKSIAKKFLKLYEPIAYPLEEYIEEKSQ